MPPLPVLRFGMDENTFLNRGVSTPIDPAPFVDDGRAMVPFRVIAEALGGTASHNSADNTVTFTDGEFSYTMPLGVPLPDGMGTPVVLNGRTFVPMRYVANLFGLTPRWDGTARAVYLYE